MNLLTGLLSFVFGKIGNKLFQTVQLRSVDPGIGQAERLAETVVSVNTGIVDRHESNVHCAGDVHEFG